MEKLVAEITGGKHGRPVEQKVVDLQILSSQLAERVLRLEGISDEHDGNMSISDKNYSDAMRVLDKALKSIEKLTDEVMYLQNVCTDLKARINLNEKDHNKLYVYVHGPLTHQVQEWTQEQHAINEYQTEAIDALQKVVLRIPGPRAKD